MRRTTKAKLLRGGAKLCAGIVLAVLTAAVGAWLALEPFLKSTILSISSQKLGVSVESEGGNFDIGRGKVCAKGIVVSSPSEFEEPYVMKLGRVELKMDPFSWLGNRVRIRELEAWDVDLRIEVQEHATNLTVLVDSIAGGGSEEGPRKVIAIEKCVFHNATVTVIDRDNARLLFTEVDLEAGKISLAEGVPQSFTVKGKCMVGEGKRKAPLSVDGTIGPITDTINLKLNVNGERIDFRQFKYYLGSEPKGIFGSNRVSVKGQLVCTADQLKGSKFVFTSSTGEMFPIPIDGTIYEPKLSGTTKAVNAFNFFLQKTVFKFFRKLNPLR